ncbi:MAG: nucleotide pyrophosphohydrolase [Thermoguttaceae bacterium]|nr:nucleotide pyrophosphohydrolase [Thermoguttaceae bacterium]
MNAPFDASDFAQFSDETTTVADLKRLVVRFAEERDWGRFHTPKNLAASAAIEAAELLERFQWLTPEESLAVKDDPEALNAVAEEIADVASYLFNLCDKLGVDFASAFAAKTRKNAEKYPAALFRGVYGADDPAYKNAKKQSRDEKRR